MCCIRELFPCSKNVRDAAQKRHRLLDRSRVESRRSATGGGGTETAARPNQSSRARRNFSLVAKKTSEGRRLRKGRCRSWRQTFGATKRQRADRWPHALD